jgi:hypothetical protein
MSNDELEQIEVRNDVRRERAGHDGEAVRDIDQLLQEVFHLRQELNIKCEADIDLSVEFDTDTPLQ